MLVAPVLVGGHRGGLVDAGRIRQLPHGGHRADLVAGEDALMHAQQPQVDRVRRARQADADDAAGLVDEAFAQVQQRQVGVVVGRLRQLGVDALHGEDAVAARQADQLEDLAGVLGGARQARQQRDGAHQALLARADVDAREHAEGLGVAAVGDPVAADAHRQLEVLGADGAVGGVAQQVRVVQLEAEIVQAQRALADLGAAVDLEIAAQNVLELPLAVVGLGRYRGEQRQREQEYEQAISHCTGWVRRCNSAFRASRLMTRRNDSNSLPSFSKWSVKLIKSTRASATSCSSICIDFLEST